MAQRKEPQEVLFVAVKFLLGSNEDIAAGTMLGRFISSSPNFLRFIRFFFNFWLVSNTAFQFLLCVSVVMTTFGVVWPVCAFFSNTNPLKLRYFHF